MQLTDYHSKYYAYELTKRCPPDSAEKLAGALFDAQVDLNPHQIDAALFAFQSPLSKGALLADEVGLGKTIEAGLVLSQRWAERKRRLLVIVPSNLRKQWYQELTEKFFLPCYILESRSYNILTKQGQRPFESQSILICSYQFARSKSEDIRIVPWDLVVIDEAHRLRNVYKPSNIIANTLKAALSGKDKLLLTATPLQNSLFELYGLVSFVDEHIFGDLKSFKEQFAFVERESVYDALKARLKPICHRTLRRQVLPYVRYTKRMPLVQPFTPEESEDRLYNLVSDYLQRDNLQALPASQRSLMTLVMRKLLASSTFAIAGTLETLSRRLQAKIRQQEPTETLGEEVGQDYEALETTAEEWNGDPEVDTLSPENKKAIEQEIADLESFRQLALSIEQNAKGKSLLVALGKAFTEAERLGAPRKALIFTESRRTQSYIQRVLADSPFNQGIVLFNGSNNDELSKQIYTEWFERHKGTDKITGSRTADIRSALVDYFREQGQIMIATEAGAEGINLQFCSLVVNYDLPWNPQRVEQRIGRCHRYGQKHDVVVVNFLNQNNAADQRVYQLLSEKFQLFEGVFGASDEVLGAIESGVDFEKRIASIYQCCRKVEEIKAAFDQLQLELGQQINDAITRTRQQLLENFDDEVREKLKIRDADSKAYLSRYEKILMALTRHELGDLAVFRDDSTFTLESCPFSGDIPLGLYELPRRSGEAHLYRLNHPLAEALLGKAKDRSLPSVEIAFDYRGHEGKVTALEPYLNRSGWMMLALFTVESLDMAEDHLIMAAVTEDGQVLDSDAVNRILTLPAKQEAEIALSTEYGLQLDGLVKEKQTSIQRGISERNARYFEAEADKLDGWADDLKVGLEREIKDIDRQIREARRSATLAATLEEKLAGQKQIKILELQRNEKRRSLFDAQDQVDRQRDQLIEKIEGKLSQRITSRNLFSIKWVLR